MRSFSSVGDVSRQQDAPTKEQSRDHSIRNRTSAHSEKPPTPKDGRRSQGQELAAHGVAQPTYVDPHFDSMSEAATMSIRPLTMMSLEAIIPSPRYRATWPARDPVV